MNLTEAIRDNDVDKVFDSLDEIEDINAPLPCGLPPLSVAGISECHLYILERLIKLGADVNHSDENVEINALILTCMNGDYDTCKFLVQNGASVNIRTVTGQPLLHLALKKGIIYVDLFLVYGADPNMCDQGNTILHLAVKEGSKSNMFKLLLRHNADPAIKNADGITPIDLANSEPQQLELVSMFMTKIEKDSSLSQEKLIAARNKVQEARKKQDILNTQSHPNKNKDCEWYLNTIKERIGAADTSEFNNIQKIYNYRALEQLTDTLRSFAICTACSKVHQPNDEIYECDKRHTRCKNCAEMPNMNMCIGSDNYVSCHGNNLFSTQHKWTDDEWLMMLKKYHSLKK